MGPDEALLANIEPDEVNDLLSQHHNLSLALGYDDDEDTGVPSYPPGPYPILSCWNWVVRLPTILYAPTNSVVELIEIWVGGVGGAKTTGGRVE